MRLAALLLILMLAGCASKSSAHYTLSIHDWRGGSVKELVKIWGQPDKKIIDPSGRSIYVYRKVSFTANEGQLSPRIGVNNQGGRPVIVNTNDVDEMFNQHLEISCTIMFMISPNGMITRSKTLGDNCYISEELAKQLANPKSGKKL